VRFRNKPAEPLPDKGASGHAQQRGGGDVGFQNQPLFADRAVAHRGEVIEVEIARPDGVQLQLRMPELLVLHLQFNLMHLQFMQRLQHGFGRQCLQTFRRQGHFFTGDVFSPLTQREFRAGRRSVIAGRFSRVLHRAPPPLL